MVTDIRTKVRSLESPRLGPFSAINLLVATIIALALNGCSAGGGATNAEAAQPPSYTYAPTTKLEPMPDFGLLPKGEMFKEEKVYETSLEQPKAKDGFYTVSTSVRAALRSDASSKAKPIVLLEAGTKLLAGHREDPEWLEIPLKDEKWGFVKRNQVKGMPPYPGLEDRNTSQASTSSSRGEPTMEEEPERPGPRTYARRGGQSPGMYQGVGDTHWIESVSDGGEIIKLEDGSLWRVDSIDQIDSMLWLPTTDIIVKESSRSLGGYILINIDDRETVGATYLGD